MSFPFIPRSRVGLTLLVLGAAGLSFSIWWFAHKPAAGRPTASAAPLLADSAVSASGHIEPEEPATHVGAPYIDGHPAIVAEVQVAEGDSVQAGQALAVLSDRPQMQSAVDQALARVALAQGKMDQIKAPPRKGDLDAQKAEALRCQQAFEGAQAEYRRYEMLQKTNDVSVSDVDAKRSVMNDARQRYEEARAHLAGLTEVRPEDIRLAESELQLSRAELERARFNLAATQVRSPIDGVVLHVRTHAGEEVGAQGVAEIAKTSSMCVIAEVYETNISAIRPGEHAEVMSDLLPGQKLAGTVAKIGREIGRTDLPSSDPAVFSDSRVVLVQVRLDNSAAVEHLIHGKVMVVIRP